VKNATTTKKKCDEKTERTAAICDDPELTVSGPSLVVAGPPATAHTGGGGRFVREYVVNTMSDALDTVVYSMLRKLVVAQKKLHDTQPQHLRARLRYLTGLRETLRAVINRRVKLLLVAPDIEPVPGEDLVTFLEEFEDSPLVAPPPPAAAAAAAAAGPLTISSDGPSAAPSAPASVSVDEVLRERAMLESSASLGKQLQRRTVKSLGLDGSVRALVALCRLKRIPFVFCMSRKRLAQAMKVPTARVSAVAILSSEGANDEYRAVVRIGALAREQYQALLPSNAQ
jgi:ribosomal protein L7Ae-like RNA K-turn-binding protein